MEGEAARRGLDFLKPKGILQFLSGLNDGRKKKKKQTMPEEWCNVKSFRECEFLK